MSTIFDNGGKRFFEYELLTLSNGTYQHSQFITDYVDRGAINIDFTRDVISGADFNILETEDLNINYLTDLIKPWLNFQPLFSTEIYKIPLGHYMLLSPNIDYDGKSKTRFIQGFDLLKALDIKTTESYSFPVGTNVIGAIESLLNDIGSWVNYQITPSDAVLGEDVSYQLGRSVLFIINSLLNMINYYPMFVTGNGVYKAIPWNANPNILHEFIDNDVSLYESRIRKNVDYTNYYNEVIVINNLIQEDTPALYKKLTMEDIGLQDHPFSYTSTLKRKPEVFQSEAVSQDYIDLRAERELRKMLEIEESISYYHDFVSRLSDGIPWQGDSFRFKNNNLNVDEVYKIVSMTYNLDVNMTINSTIRRVRSTWQNL